MQQLFSSVWCWGKGGLQYLTWDWHVVCQAAIMLIWKAHTIYVPEIAEVHCSVFFCCRLSQTVLNILKIFPRRSEVFQRSCWGKVIKHMCFGANYRRPFLGFYQSVAFLVGAFSSVNTSIKTGEKALLLLCTGRNAIFLLLAAFWKKYAVGCLGLLI